MLFMLCEKMFTYLLHMFFFPFQYKIILDSLGLSHHSPQSHSLPCPYISAHCPCSIPPRRPPHIHLKPKKTNKTVASLHHLSCPSNSSSLSPVILEAVVCHAVCPFSLPWVKGLIQGLWPLHTSITRLLDILWHSVMETLKLSFCSMSPFTCSIKSYVG